MKSVFTFFAAIMLISAFSAPRQSKAVVMTGGTSASVAFIVIGGLVVLSQGSKANSSTNTLILLAWLLNEENPSISNQVDYSDRLQALVDSSVYTAEQAEIIHNDLVGLGERNLAVNLNTQALSTIDGRTQVMTSLTEQGLDRLTVEFFFNMIGVHTN